MNRRRKKHDLTDQEKFDDGSKSSPVKLKIKLGPTMSIMKTNALDFDNTVESSLTETSSPALSSGSYYDEWNNVDDEENEIEDEEDEMDDEEDEMDDVGNEMEDEGGFDNEEDAWLSAIEQGKLSEYEEEMRAGKKQLTARQKSLKDTRDGRIRKVKNLGNDYITFPIKSLKKKEEGDDLGVMERKVMRVEKRKIRAREKKEKDKKDTMTKLLKKKEAKLKYAVHQQVSASPASTDKADKKSVMPPMIRYVDKLDEKLLCFPHVKFIPEYITRISESSLRHNIPSLPSLCSVEGCSNVKKYATSHTKLPVCSLRCYKVLQK